MLLGHNAVLARLVQHERLSLRLKLAKAIVGSRAQNFIPSLDMIDRWRNGDGSVLKGYLSKADPLTANLGWPTPPTSIVEAAAAMELKAYRRTSDGELEEANDAKARQLLELLGNPNNVQEVRVEDVGGLPRVRLTPPRSGRFTKSAAASRPGAAPSTPHGPNPPACSVARGSTRKPSTNSSREPNAPA